MVLNNKGQIQALVGIMIAVTIIVLALAIAPTSKQFTDGARNSTDVLGSRGLDCTNSSISDYDKGACILVDLFTPTFFFILLAIAGLIIGAKIIIENVI